MNWGFVGALSGLLAVAAGAFGAHGLKNSLTPEALGWWQTAAQYQIYHSLALAIVALWGVQRPSTATTVAGWAYLAGIVVFSGSLYALALSGARWLGAITPIGGLSLMIGWAALAWAAYQRS